MAKDAASEAQRMRDKRMRERTVTIPACSDRRVREELEAAPPIDWLAYMFGPDSGSGVLVGEFDRCRTAILDAITAAIEQRSDFGCAAPRATGKSTLLEVAIVRAQVVGEVDFAVLLQAAGLLAENSIKSITALYETPRMVELYPEFAVPIIAAGGHPHRAKHLLATGQRHDNGEPFEQIPIGFTIKASELTLPNVPGSPGADAILLARGLDGAVRGLKRGTRRPTLVAIDDPETADDARSAAAIAKLDAKIEQDLGSLGTGERPCGRVFISTVQVADSASDQFTDPKRKPAWKGQRHRLVETYPARADLWADYVTLRTEDFATGSGAAAQLLDDNYDEMHRGAVVTAPQRFEPGKQRSALQAYYDHVARYGEASAASELQNEPLEEERPIANRLTANAIQRRINGHGRGVVPVGAQLVVQGIDVGRHGLHSCTAAFKNNAEVAVIDYGFWETGAQVNERNEATERAIRRTLAHLAGERPVYRFADTVRPDGEVVAGATVPVVTTVVDSRYMEDAVKASCVDLSRAGYGNWLPAIGHGKSHGCASASFWQPKKPNSNVAIGDHFYLRRDAHGIPVVHHDADFFKLRVHNAWSIDEGEPGSASLYGAVSEPELARLHMKLAPAMVAHMSFAKHQTAEFFGEMLKAGVIVEGWQKTAGRVANHYLDAFALCWVAAYLNGLRVVRADLGPQRSGAAVSPAVAPPEPIKPGPSPRPPRRPRRPPRGPVTFGSGRQLRRDWG